MSEADNNVQVQKVKTSKLAIASLLCVLLAFLSFLIGVVAVFAFSINIIGFGIYVPCLFLLAGLVLGIAADIVIKLHRKELKGYCYTILPIVLGSVFLYFCIAGLSGPRLKRSSTGSFVRWCLGESGAEQSANDLAEDVEEKIGLDKIQAWAMDILDRYRRKEVSTAGESPYWSLGEVKLDSREIPKFILKPWDISPDVSIHLSNSGEPRFVTINWYLYGLLVGDPNFVPEGDHYWYLRELKPGVYVCHLYK